VEALHGREVRRIRERGEGAERSVHAVGF